MRFRLCLAALVALSAASAGAEPPKSYFLFGAASSSFTATVPAGCTLNGDDSSVGGTLGAGYSFNDRLAVELGFMSIGSYDLTLSCPGPTTSTVTVPERGLQLSGLLHLPLGAQGESSGFNAFARLGAYSWSENAQSGTEPMLGLGLDWRIGSHSSLRFEYTDMGDEIDALQFALRIDY